METGSNHDTTILSGNDDILARLDQEHFAAHEKTIRLMEADVEAEVDESPETKTAFLALDQIARAAEFISATSLDCLRSKTRILARQGRALTAGEMLFKEGEILQRLGGSVLADALAIFGADYDRAAAPEAEARAV